MGPFHCGGSGGRRAWLPSYQGEWERGRGRRWQGRGQVEEGRQETRRGGGKVAGHGAAVTRLPGTGLYLQGGSEGHVAAADGLAPASLGWAGR